MSSRNLTQASIYLKFLLIYTPACSLPHLQKRAGLLFRDIQIGTSSVLNGNTDTVRSYYVQCVCVCQCLLRSRGLFVGQKKVNVTFPLGLLLSDCRSIEEGVLTV